MICVQVGLSPLARGNRFARPFAGGCDGSIPARAGKPRAASSARGGWRVYPRSRGETTGMVAMLQRGMGLSPLARGNLAGGVGTGTEDGSIPARAGKPPADGKRCSACTVYPRSRGETGAIYVGTNTGVGLSPLARGNHSSAPIMATQ